jgi:hypothetical protein
MTPVYQWHVTRPTPHLHIRSPNHFKLCLTSLAHWLLLVAGVSVCVGGQPVARNRVPRRLLIAAPQTWLDAIVMFAYMGGVPVVSEPSWPLTQKSFYDIPVLGRLWQGWSASACDGNADWTSDHLLEREVFEPRGVEDSLSVLVLASSVAVGQVSPSRESPALQSYVLQSLPSAWFARSNPVQIVTLRHDQHGMGPHMVCTLIWVMLVCC